MRHVSQSKFIAQSIVLAAIGILLFFLALGVYAHGASYARFAGEPYDTAEARSYSGRYSRLRQGWETDLSFTTTAGQTLRLPEQRISSSEKSLLEAGHPIRRQYLIAAPHIIKTPGRAASGQAENALALLLTAVSVDIQFSKWIFVPKAADSRRKPQQG